MLGRSHRHALAKAKIVQVMDKTKKLLGLPEDYRVAIVPASDTGAVEMAMWSMLGSRPVTALGWESFGNGWIADIVSQLKLKDVTQLKAPFGQLPDFSKVDWSNDVVFPWNGTTSGVKVPHNGDFIPETHEGLVFCDATSAAFAMEIPWNKIDVGTLSWQKALGGEAAHGMIFLSPRAVERISTFAPDRPLPKIFRMMAKGAFNEELFKGAVINTVSMLCVEDFLDALDWAEKEGGLPAMIERSMKSLHYLEEAVERLPWLEFLAEKPETRSNTSVTFKITDMDAVDIKKMTALLDKCGAAYDINAYMEAPPGIRIWCGCTVEPEDVKAMIPWLEWAHEQIKCPNQLKVIVTDGMADSGVKKMESMGIQVIKQKLTKEELAAGALADYDCVSIRSATKITRGDIEAAVAREGCKLKIIARAGVGVDNVDIPAATEKGIIIVNAPRAATRSVAELAIGHLLAMARKITYADRTLRTGSFDKAGCAGTELYGKTLGVIGFGRIGQLVAELATALGMKIVAYDPAPFAAGFCAQHGYGFCEKVDDVFKKCTHITLHVPLLPSTDKLVNLDRLKMMPGTAPDGTKCGNYIVSAARGGVVDEEALLVALKEGIVAAAALDVFAVEAPWTINPELLAHPRLQCTPHIGASTMEAQSRCGDEVVDSIVGAFNGKIPEGAFVNPKVVPRA